MATIKICREADHLLPSAQCKDCCAKTRQVDGSTVFLMLSVVAAFLAAYRGSFL
jgi:hypothetical protein